MKYLTLLLIPMIAIAIILISCDRQQELCFDHGGPDDPRVLSRVIFDWTECPGANPSIMDLYLIPTDGSHYTRRTLPGRDGGTIYVPKGHYAAVALNSDCDNVKVLNPQSYDTFSLSLRGVDEYSSQTASLINSVSDTVQYIYQTPGYLWTAWIDDLEVTGEDIIIKMSETFCRYSVEILNLSDSHRVNAVKGILYGNHQALGFNGVLDDKENCGLIFSMGKDKSKYPRPSDKNLLTDDSHTPPTNSIFYGEFLTLGHCGKARIPSRITHDNAKTHNMTLCYELTNGQTAYAQVDVTEQIHSQPTERCHIVLDTLKLPPASGSNGGLDLTISEWQIVYIDVPAN